MLLLNVEMPSSGCKPSLQAVQPFSTEAAAILSYLYEGMPEDTEHCQIERWECQLLFLPYQAYKETVRTELEWKLEKLEAWLYIYGTDIGQNTNSVGSTEGGRSVDWNGSRALCRCS